MIAITIGNTHIRCATFKGSRIIRQKIIPTRSYSGAKLKAALPARMVSPAIVCSVVPAVQHRLLADLRRLSGSRPLLVGKDIRVPLRNLYHIPRELGQDRLVNAYAAATLYGAPLVVADFGTALTFDAVSAKGAYQGGMILPGLSMAVKALHQQTARLPLVKLRQPPELIGRSTTASILSGVLNGYAALTKGLFAALKKELGPQTKLILTGGDSRLLQQVCPSAAQRQPDLTLKGLALLLARHT